MVMQALNVLGETSWKINTRVLDVIESLWKDGGDVAGLIKAGDVSTYYCCLLVPCALFGALCCPH